MSSLQSTGMPTRWNKSKRSSLVGHPNDFTMRGRLSMCQMLDLRFGPDGEFNNAGDSLSAVDDAITGQ